MRLVVGTSLVAGVEEDGDNMSDEADVGILFDVVFLSAKIATL